MAKEVRMAELSVFNSVSLDGYFTDSRNDMSWAHRQDAEWAAFTTENAKGEARLIFGRITYEMMRSFWPTPAAMEQMPDVAKKMNGLPKVVFSRSLDNATWSNTRLVKTDIIAAMRAMKEDGGTPSGYHTIRPSSPSPRSHPCYFAYLSAPMKCSETSPRRRGPSVV
jgi:dihydrofolate reductase